MARQQNWIGWGLRASFCLAVAAMALYATTTVPVSAQDGANSQLDAPAQPVKRELPSRLSNKPSQPPAFTIPVQQLGFSAPGPLYLGQRNSLVSLDFIDESRLLFTFRVPGLIHREAGAEDERQIRAMVLSLPAGTVQAEALWTVHDRVRYLWMLKDGHFLLRDRNDLELGNASLELKPFLRFPGQLLYLEMDPAQQFLVTNSREPVAQSDMVVRVLHRDSGQVMLVSRTSATVHLAINSDGYLESLRSKDDKWMLNLNYFSGGSAILGQVDSTCSPLLDFVAQRELLATTCTDSGERKLVAMGTDGRPLWERQTPKATAWPLLVRSPDGSRVAWEALAITHEVNARSPIDQEDIKGQMVEILNAADGKVVLDAQANPVLDAGGNVAISPSGRRVAVINDGQIQVFELPSPPLSDSGSHPPGR
jgi:hypothetical protein